MSQSASSYTKYSPIEIIKTTAFNRAALADPDHEAVDDLSREDVSIFARGSLRELRAELHRREFAPSNACHGGSGWAV